MLQTGLHRGAGSMRLIGCTCATLLLIAGCDAIRHTPRTLAKKVSFDAYIVSPAKTPTSKVVDDPATKGSMYLINPPFISAADVATVQRSKDDGQNQSLMVKLTPA